MRISIIGDVHCGFAWGEERGEDSFNALSDAIEKSKGADLIIQTGDLFDSRLPRPEIWSRAARILSKTQSWPCKTKLVGLIGKQQHEIELALRGTPIVVVSGNHERRSKQLVNPVQALEHAGLLVDLHASTAVFEIEGKKIAVHGMSAVPERYAKDCLMNWNPRPVPGALNILILHQSIEPYVYSPLEPPSLKLEDLPTGFDLYVVGHMHWHDQQRLKGAHLLLTGSISHTAVHKLEASQNKSIWSYDGIAIERQALTNQRKVIWKEFNIGPDVRKEMEEELSAIQPTSPKPLAVFRVKGTIGPDSPPPVFNDLEQQFANKAIVKINSSVQSEGFAAQVELLHALREARLSPEETGLRILTENMKQADCGIQVEEIFDLLVEGNDDAIFAALVRNNDNKG